MQLLIVPETVGVFENEFDAVVDTVRDILLVDDVLVVGDLDIEGETEVVEEAFADIVDVGTDDDETVTVPVLEFVDVLLDDVLAVLVVDDECDFVIIGERVAEFDMDLMGDDVTDFVGAAEAVLVAEARVEVVCVGIILDVIVTNGEGVIVTETFADCVVVPKADAVFDVDMERVAGTEEVPERV